MTPPLRDRLASSYGGCDDQPCALMRIDDKRLLLVTKDSAKGPVQAWVVNLDDLARDKADGLAIEVPGEEPSPSGIDLSKAPVEIRTVERRQAFVDGKPVGAPFE